MPGHIKHLTHHPVAVWLIRIIIIIGLYFLWGFTIPVLGALIIAFASWPAYEKLVDMCKAKTWISASIAITLIVLIVVVPFSLMINYLFHELQYAYFWLSKLNASGVPTPKWIANFPVVGGQADIYWKEYLLYPNGLTELTQALGIGRIANIGSFLLSASGKFLHLSLTFILMLITLFFVYKDGKQFSKQIDHAGEKIFPDRWHRISRVVPLMVSSTVTGMVIIAIGEGIILGIAYAIAGAPAPLTLGMLTGFFALIPGGAPASMSLVSLYLVGSGHYMNGGLLFLWGAVELFIVDKTIRPRLVGGPAKLPFIPTFFGLVGGVTTMGIVGLFIGPVIMALLVALWREWLLDEDNNIHMSSNPEHTSTIKVDLKK